MVDMGWWMWIPDVNATVMEVVGGSTDQAPRTYPVRILWVPPAAALLLLMQMTMPIRDRQPHSMRKAPG